MEQNNGFASQNVIIENRKKLDISGVKDVLEFDDETILLVSQLGKITIKGETIHITAFNNETGDLTATGKIHAVVYMTDEKNSGGFISRIFR